MPRRRWQRTSTRSQVVAGHPRRRPWRAAGRRRSPCRPRLVIVVIFVVVVVVVVVVVCGRRWCGLEAVVAPLPRGRRRAENHESFVAIGDAHFYGYVDQPGGGGESRRQIQQQEQKPTTRCWWYQGGAGGGAARGLQPGLHVRARPRRARERGAGGAPLPQGRGAAGGAGGGAPRAEPGGGSFGLDGGGHGYGESILGDELHAKAVLWVSLAGLRLRRTARGGASNGPRRRSSTFD